MFVLVLRKKGAPVAVAATGKRFNQQKNPSTTQSDRRSPRKADVMLRKDLGMWPST